MTSRSSGARTWRLPSVGAAALVVAAVAAGPVAAAPPPTLFDVNLIANPGAEAGLGSPSSIGGVVAVPGWTTTGNFTVVEYETQAGVPDSFPTFDDSGPTVRGTNLFVGGPDNASSSARQTISIASAGKLVDLGLVSYSLAGWFGGFAAQNDHATLSVSFRRANGATIETVSVGGVDASDRGGATGLLPRAAFGDVPAGTRLIEVRLQMTRDATFLYNDGYADNLSLVLTNLFGSNLVRNPGAELGAGSRDGLDVLELPGWTTTGNTTVGVYGPPDFPAQGAAGPSAGAQLIAGGPANDHSTASQAIGVSRASRLIDTGSTSYRLSGWLGGFLDQNDHATFTVTFLDAGGAELASASIGPVTAADRNGASSLQFRSASGAVPSGTREIVVTLEMTRDAPPEFTYNDGYGDDLSLVLLP